MRILWTREGDFKGRGNLVGTVHDGRGEHAGGTAGTRAVRGGVIEGAKGWEEMETQEKGQSWEAGEANFHLVQREGIKQERREERRKGY